MFPGGGGGGLKRQVRYAKKTPPTSAKVHNVGYKIPIPSTSSWRGAWLSTSWDTLTLVKRGAGIPNSRVGLHIT
jgi:hypothetical protein